MKRCCISALAAFLFFVGCKKDSELLRTQNLEGGKISAFGHGGMGIASLWPMDSKESLLRAINSEADGSEMDVQMSQDSVLFLYHSIDLDESTQCTGAILNLPASQISCEYKSLVHKNIPVITLEALLQDPSRDTSKVLTLECKSYGLQAQNFGPYVRALKKLLEKYGVKHVMMESTLPGFLQELKAEINGAKVFLYSEDVEWCITTADSLNFYGVTFDMNRVNKGLVEKAHSKNLRVTLFNQKTRQENIESVLMQPDFIQTDKLEDLVEILKQ